MQLVPLRTPKFRRQHTWLIPVLVSLAAVELVLTVTIVHVELWSMTVNIKYSFFFIGFIASTIFTFTCIATLTVVCCARKALRCALVGHVLSMLASTGLLLCDVRFLRYPLTCFWPNNACNQPWTNLYLLTINLGTSAEINATKIVLIKVQLACAALMILTCSFFIAAVVLNRMHHRPNTVHVDPHASIELGRVQSPPSPNWPIPPRTFPPSPEF